MKKLTIFIASSNSENPLFIKAISDLANLIAQQKITLVYGGSNVGLMGKLATTTLEAGGQVIGVYPKNMGSDEIPHASLTQLINVNSIAERVAIMQELGDGFMMFPGGIGTLEELFIIWNQIRLGILNKPIGILNINHFYDPLLRFLHEDMSRENFISKTSLQIPLIADDVNKLYAMIKEQVVNKTNFSQ